MGTVFPGNNSISDILLLCFGEIRKKIEKYLEKVKDETFICSTPFGSEWSRMTTSAKRTATSQMKILVDEGKIEKVQSTSKAHQATVYKKRGGK